jgi:hypothetical protein
MAIRDDAEPTARGKGGGVMRWLFVSALVIACSSCGDERLRSARSDSADRERPAETLGALLARLAVPTDRLVPLREVFSSPSIVGRQVRVAGHCISPSPLSVPEPPARGGDIWRLETDGTTVLVVGARPRACWSLEPRLVTLTVVVAEDTLAAIADLPAVPRRYLVVVDKK